MPQVLAARGTRQASSVSRMEQAANMSWPKPAAPARSAGVTPAAQPRKPTYRPWRDLTDLGSRA